LVDELDRADEITEPLGVQTVAVTREISDDQLKEMQAEDIDLGPVINWLEKGLPPSSDILRQHSLDARNLWVQVPAVHLLNGLLVKKASDEIQPQLVVPHQIRKKLFEMVHVGPLSAHLGMQKTYLQMKLAYYWPEMKRDIAQWCKQCNVCAQCKGPPTRRQGKLQKVITGAPLDIVAVDILSGLPQTPDGMKYILVLTDYFTKWVHLPFQMQKLPPACGQCTTDFSPILACHAKFIPIWAEISNPNCSTNCVCWWEQQNPTRQPFTQRATDNRNGS